jgi:oxygen-dependent protoporphyrinogen oxidase
VSSPGAAPEPSVNGAHATPATTTLDVAVIGGGISGLTAAHELLRINPDIAVAVFETSDRLGGKIHTTDIDGVAVDCGPDAFLNRQPEMRELCEELGLADHFVSPEPLGAYLYIDGSLHRLPAKTLLGVPTDSDALASFEPLSAEARSHIDRNVSDPPPAIALDGPHNDISVAELVRRHLGNEITTRLVSPLLGGIHAGDPERLSAQLATPQLVAAATEHPSLVAGARAALARSARTAASTADTPVFLSVRGGLGRIVDALARELGLRVTTGNAARSVRPHPNGGVEIHLKSGPVRARTAIIATPAGPASAMVGEACPEAAALLGGIGYTPVVLVTQRYEADDIAQPLDASGVLVPHDQHLLMTACSWTSSKFPHLGEASGGVLVRISVGHRNDSSGCELGNTALLERLHEELTPLLGLSGQPTHSRITRWRQALPQFDPGHLGRVQEIRAALAKDLSGVVVTGAAYEGLGLPACVRQGRAAAHQVASQLQ